MATIIKTTNPRHSFSADQYYEKVTRWIRWAAIAVAGLTYPADGRYRLWVFTLVVLAIIYNSLRLSPLMRRGWFASKVNMLVTDNLFVVAIMALTGASRSPYFVFFTLMIISAAYWYGARAVMMVIAFQTLAWLGLLFIHTPVQPSDSTVLLLIKLLALVIVGWQAERFTNADRNERRQENRLNEQINLERQRLITLINSVAVAVITVDNEGKVTLANAEALDLLNSNTPYGKPLNDLLLIKEGDGDRFDVLAASRKTQGTLHRDDLYISGLDNALVRLEVSSAPIISSSTDEAEGDGFILLVRDVTQEKAVDTERDEFISVTSHELRTPLAIAEATLSTALLPSIGKIDPAVRELVNQAHENIVFLGELAADLGTLSRAEKGVLRVNLSKVDLAELLEQLKNDYHGQFQRKGLKLTVKNEGKVPPILTSLFHVQEILQNFITNALKYTKSGGVTMAVRPAGNGDGVIFSVQDTGVGISASDQQKLFQRFFRAVNDQTQGTTGTGLGLYITQQLAKRLGGKVWFKSRLGSGSTFYLQVPADINTNEPSSTETPTLATTKKAPKKGTK